MKAPAARRLADEMGRYKGVVASFAYSFANFVLAFALQKHLAPADFGLFALVQLYLQFGMGLSNALFCSPILLAIDGAGRLGRGVLASFARSNLIVCLLGGAVLAGLTWLGRPEPLSAALVAILAVATWLRWFYRAAELADGNAMGPFLADLFYSVVVLAGAAILAVAGRLGFDAAIGVLIAGSMAAALSLSRGAWHDLGDFARAPFAPFLASFRQHGRWATLGVLTTEATANSYAYIVAAMFGPAAFAPIAAVSLFYRPVPILVQALTQYERPRMIRIARSDKAGRMHRDVIRFRIVAISGAVANVLLVLAILRLLPDLIGNAAYARGDLLPAAVLLGVIQVVRAARAADSAALQALGRFRPLAWITVWTAPVSLTLIVLVALMVPGQVVFVLAGVLAGEALMCLMILRLYRRSVLTGAAPASHE